MAKQPTTLALEFSQRAGSIAMMNCSGDTETREVDSAKREKDEVFPSIEMMSTSLGITPIELELVVVSIGPGGFTGLRTSVAIAKMVALASEAKIVSVESAIVTVQQANLGAGPFLVVSSVKGDGCRVSMIQKNDCKWKCVSQNVSVASLGHKLAGIKAVFANEFLPKQASMQCKEHQMEIHPCNPDATSLLQIGLTAYNSGEFVDPDQLLPIYPREPEAVRLWNKRRSTQQ